MPSAPAHQVDCIVGARPNFVKIAPIIRALGSRDGIATRLVHTGQHYDVAMNAVFFEELAIPTPDINLEVGSGTNTEQTARIMTAIEPVFLDSRPHLVLVVGDVNSTLAATLVAAKLNIPVAHVEAGLRSFDRTMPEEINRILTDALADYLFVTEEDAIEHLLKEGRPRESIYLVGNVMIDSLRHFLPIAQKSTIGDDLGLKRGENWHRFGVLTLHRPSNVDSTEKLAELLGAIDAIAAQIPVIFPVHPRTQQRVTQAGIKTHPQLKLIPPVGYLDFLCLLSKATLVLTDSGGIQEETTALGVPCLTLRENTERPITISEGTNQLIGTDPTKILAAAQDVLSGKGKPGRIPPFWDGHAAERIVEVLLRKSPLGPHRKSTLPVT
jgi:UDP-N-acetylglucosamine 2-epimerase (non-hydrolysing)